MRICEDRTGTLDGFRACLDAAVADADTKGLLVFACDSNGFRPETLDPILRAVPVPLVGGVFPAILHGQEKRDRGSIVVGMPCAIDVQVIHGLSDDAADYDAVLDAAAPPPGTTTMLVLVDGFATRISAFIDGLFNAFGLELNYIGGGAGSLCMRQTPCLLTNGGLLQDAAVLGALDLPSGVGVSHGWESVSGPFRVTASDRNVVLSLDWKPAFEVYREVVEHHSGKRFADGGRFFDVAKAYPFGIAKLGAERIVRDPVSVREDQGLVCIGEVPEGSFVDVLHGNEQSLVEAAGRALALGTKALGQPSPRQLVVFIDCISRVLFLGDRFPEELRAVSDGSHPLVGACSIGEVANSGSDYLEFYNKTAVVGRVALP